MRLAAASLAVLTLAACGSGHPPMNDAQLGNTIENIAEARPKPKQETPPPALRPVAVQAGAACSFSEGERILFVSTAGGASANVDGSDVQFAPSGPIGETGGFWVTERYSISIGRLADDGGPEGVGTAWPARLVLTDRRRDENAETRVAGSWRCGG